MDQCDHISECSIRGNKKSQQSQTFGLFFFLSIPNIWVVKWWELHKQQDTLLFAPFPTDVGYLKVKSCNTCEMCKLIQLKAPKKIPAATHQDAFNSDFDMEYTITQSLARCVSFADSSHPPAF